MWGCRMKELYIIGAGGFGREVAWLVEQINEVEPQWKVMGFLDDNQEVHGSTVGGFPVIGDCSFLQSVKREACQIIQGKRIAPNIIVGAGAVVTKDLEKSGTYVGVPTRRIR